jgi:hypothetical protein
MATALEGIYAYVVIGNYRRHYHVGMRLPDDKAAEIHDELLETDVLLPIISSSVIVNVLAFTAACVGWDSFASAQTVLDPRRFGNLLLQGLYFVSTTMVTVGYGDIVPKKALGQVITMAMHVQSLLLIVGMFSALMSYGIRSNQGGSEGVSDKAPMDSAHQRITARVLRSPVPPPERVPSSRKKRKKHNGGRRRRGKRKRHR